MKKMGLWLVIFVTLFLTGNVHASTCYLYVDSAPNKYGSPNYPNWESNAFSNASTGSFINMANSSNPTNVGTTNFEAEDMTVYSFGDLGKRLHFIYYIPNTTINDLSGKFSISLFYEWDGVTYDFYNDYYSQTWIEPTSWQDYNNGVIGTAGFAWWGAYNSNTAEELANDLIDINNYQGKIYFSAKLESETCVLTANHTPAVPLPGALLLLGAGLVRLAAHVRRRPE